MLEFYPHQAVVALFFIFNYYPDVVVVFAGTQLEDMVNKGLFCPATGRERMLELLTLLELLEPRQRMIFDTTHPTNIIKIKGTLLEERQRLIGLIERNMGVRD